MEEHVFNGISNFVNIIVASSYTAQVLLEVSPRLLDYV